MVASQTCFPFAQRALGLALCLLWWLVGAPEAALADEGGRWNAPFGGTFNATFTAASDYSFAGVSQTKLGPAAQMSLDYRSREFNEDLPVWFYASGWGSNIDFPTTGPGVEVDLAAGEPAVERRAGGVQHLVPAPAPVDRAGLLGPETFGVAQRALMQCAVFVTDGHDGVSSEPTAGLALPMDLGNPDV